MKLDSLSPCWAPACSSLPVHFPGCLFVLSHCPILPPPLACTPRVIVSSSVSLSLSHPPHHSAPHSESYSHTHTLSLSLSLSHKHTHIRGHGGSVACTACTAASQQEGHGFDSRMGRCWLWGAGPPQSAQCLGGLSPGPFCVKFACSPQPFSAQVGSLPGLSVWS